MSSESGWTPAGTIILYAAFWYNVLACVSSVFFSYHVLYPQSLFKVCWFFVSYHIGLVALLYCVPSLLGPNSCKPVKFISAACQKYKNTASFLFSCIYLFLSAHPILDNEGRYSRHAMALCAASSAAINWVKLSGSSFKAYLIFACWFMPASIVAFMYLFGTHDLIIYWPTKVAVCSLFVPVDYKLFFRSSLIFNKPQ